MHRRSLCHDKNFLGVQTLEKQVRKKVHRVWVCLCDCVCVCACPYFVSWLCLQALDQRLPVISRWPAPVNQQRSPRRHTRCPFQHSHTHTHMCFVPVFCPLCFYIPFFVCVSFQCCLSVFFQSFTSISASIVFLTFCVSIFTFCVVYLVCFDDHISNMICNALWCFLGPRGPLLEPSISVPSRPQQFFLST